ncbi:MAG: hypothetical protein ACK5K8_11025 [Pseudanabaena sp.]
MSIPNPIIFTHYGHSAYLSKTLRCAKLTNQNTKVILIGDDNNLELATSNHVEHHHFNSLVESDLRTEFYRVFKPIKGTFHPLIRNGRNWLMYVFERWFYVYELAQKMQLESFWHFDSDTIILKDLSKFSEYFSDYDSTEQCNGNGLNGFVKTCILKQYLIVINQLFLDDDFLKKQQEEFDIINPEYAFTEMRAWVNAKQKLSFNTYHLGKVLKGKTWDDSIVQGEDIGYQMSRLKSGQVMKNIYWENGFYCYNKHLQQSVEFVTLNLSHSPIFVFDWVLSHIENKPSTKYLHKTPVPLKEIMIGIGRNLKRKTTHYLSKLAAIYKMIWLTLDN